MSLAVKNIELVELWAVEASVREVLTLAALDLELLRPFFNFLILEIVDEMVLNEGFIVEKDHKKTLIVNKYYVDVWVIKAVIRSSVVINSYG